MNLYVLAVFSDGPVTAQMVAAMDGEQIVELRIADLCVRLTPALADELADELVGLAVDDPGSPRPVVDTTGTY
jgi:hypothetical protein